MVDQRTILTRRKNNHIGVVTNILNMICEWHNAKRIATSI
jgi:hypothetical protein